MIFVSDENRSDSDSFLHDWLRFCWFELSEHTQRAEWCTLMTSNCHFVDGTSTSSCSTHHASLTYAINVSFNLMRHDYCWNSGGRRLGVAVIVVHHHHQVIILIVECVSRSCMCALLCCLAFLSCLSWLLPCPFALPCLAILCSTLLWPALHYAAMPGPALPLWFGKLHEGPFAPPDPWVLTNCWKYWFFGT